MANNKFSGYTPDPKKETKAEGTTEIHNRLDRVQPHEFRKGMDYELTSMGCSRLAESTIEERQKATETVLKNLEEHGGYYTSLITYETQFRNEVEDIKKPTFKNWLSEQDETKMEEVDKRDKNVGEEVDKERQMTEPKYNKESTTIPFKTTQLKEAIKKQIKNLLSEKKDDNEEKEPTKKQVKGLDKQIKALDAEKEKIEKEKKKLQSEIKPLVQAFNNKDIDRAKYDKKIGDRPKRIKDIIARIGEIEKEKEAVLEEIKTERYSVAETVMTREVHRKLLEIIKSKGINLREGAEGVRLYYEIAKVAYMEGLTAGLTD